MFAKIRFYTFTCLLLKKVNCLPTKFLCLCARGKHNRAGDAFEVEKGNGDVRDYDVRTAAAVVLYDTSTRCTHSSPEPLVPGAAYTWYLVRYMQAPNRVQIRGTGVCLERKNSL